MTFCEDFPRIHYAYVHLVRLEYNIKERCDRNNCGLLVTIPFDKNHQSGVELSI